MIRSHRLSLAALAVIFGLASCGDPNVTPPLANQPKIIELAGSPTRSANAAPAAATVGAADSKMAIMAPTDFVYDGDLPALAGTAGSWYFAPGQQPDLQRIARLAASFGIAGPVRTLPPDQGGGWAVGPLNPTGAVSNDVGSSGPVLTVSADGMLSWWLSASPTSVGYACASPGVAVDVPAGAGVAGSSGTAIDATTSVTAAPADKPLPAETVPPGEIVAPDCPSPQPPAGVPTKDEALATAKQLFADWGYDVSAYQFEAPYADEWGASVNASLLLDGMKTPIVVSVGFGENGAVTWASGTLAEPQRGADYPTIGAAAGLERLKTQQNLYGIGGGTIMRATDEIAPQPAVGAPVSAPLTPDVAIAPCEAGPASDCAPVSTQPITVTLTSVKPDLTMQWATDGTVWLLPAYTFGSADSGQYTVIAVDDAYIQQPAAEPASTEPVQDPGVVPVPATAPAAGSGTGGGPTTEPSTTPVP